MVGSEKNGRSLSYQATPLVASLSQAEPTAQPHTQTKERKAQKSAGPRMRRTQRAQDPKSAGPKERRAQTTQDPEVKSVNAERQPRVCLSRSCRLGPASFGPCALWALRRLGPASFGPCVVRAVRRSSRAPFGPCAVRAVRLYVDVLSAAMTALSNTSAPFTTSSGFVNSFGEWLIPPTLGTKIIAIGAIRDISCASCPAPLGIR